MQGKQNTTKKTLNNCQAVTESEDGENWGRLQGSEESY